MTIYKSTIQLLALETRVSPDINQAALGAIAGAAAATASDWVQISGPKPGVADVNVHTETELKPVTVKRPHPTRPNETITEDFVLRVSVEAKQGWKPLPGQEQGTVYANGTFKVPETVVVGVGFEKSLSTSVEIGVAVQVNGSVAVIPTVLEVGGGVETSVVMGVSKTDTKFHYFEEGITITEENALMKGKDVKVVWMVKFIEVKRSYELVTSGGHDVETGQKSGYPAGWVFTASELARLKDARMIQGDIVAQRAGLTTGTKHYWQEGNPRPATFTRNPAAQDNGTGSGSGGTGSGSGGSGSGSGGTGSGSGSGSGGTGSGSGSGGTGSGSGGTGSGSGGTGSGSGSGSGGTGSGGTGSGGTGSGSGSGSGSGASSSEGEFGEGWYLDPVQVDSFIPADEISPNIQLLRLQQWLDNLRLYGSVSVSDA